MSPTLVLEVIDGGLLTTIQDLGRPEAGRWGVPRGGAADTRSLAIANALLGNDPGAAALEITLAGPVLRAHADTTVALAGADLRAYLTETGEPLRPGASLAVRAGQTLSLVGPVAGGARGYLAVPGGFEVPVLLGSRATSAAGGFGGHEGRELRPGDLLHARAGGLRPPARWPAPFPRPARVVAVRITLGPHVDGPDDPVLATLATARWSVASASNRMGLRLLGPPLPARAGSGELASHGVLPGAVQVPPDGCPIVLLADAQPTGGYPVPAVAIAADLPVLGQLRPGDELSLAVVTATAAVAALRAATTTFQEAVAHLREARGWDDLWHGAGG